MLAVALTLCVALAASAARLRVFAASSLTESFQEIGKRFERTHPGDTIEFNFAGSQILRAQIEQGAPADVLASADLLHWQALRRAHLVNKYSVFAHNTLAVVTPPTPGRVRRLQDLSLPGVRLVLAGGNVPAGRYADQVIWALDASGRFGRGYRRRVAANVVSRETNVRSVLSKVMLGEADAGIVYVTDAVTTKGKVNWLAIPARFNATAIYPITMIADSTQKALAAEFIRFVRGGESKRILASHGFRP